MEYRRYITRTGARFRALCRRDIDLPKGTEVEGHGNLLVYKEQILCTSTSQTALDYFVQNDDGKGHRRGKLIGRILRVLQGKDAQQRWDKVWESELCAKYRRPEHQDFWLWSRAFYDAPVSDLAEIARLVGA